jgi:hypothetical protein
MAREPHRFGYERPDGGIPAVDLFPSRTLDLSAVQAGGAVLDLRGGG